VPNFNPLVAAAIACFAAAGSANAETCDGLFAKKQRYEARAERYFSNGDTARARLERRKAQEYEDDYMQCLQYEDDQRYSEERQAREDAQAASQLLQFGLGVFGGLGGGGSGGSGTQHHGHGQ